MPHEEYTKLTEKNSLGLNGFVKWKFNSSQNLVHKEEKMRKWGDKKELGLKREKKETTREKKIWAKL